MNLISTFLETARREGSRQAIVARDGSTISFSELALRSGRLATKWRLLGLESGDRVLVAMPVGIELYLAIAALWRLGAVIVFPEPAMGLEGVRRAAEVSGPKSILVSGIYQLLPLLVTQLGRSTRRLRMDFADAGDPVEDLAADHPALISFTSGSTGRPKAIVRSHRFLTAQNEAVRELLAPQRNDETDLVAFPVFVIANLSFGVASVLPNWRTARPDTARLNDIAAHLSRHRVTRALVQPVIAGKIAAGRDSLQLDALFTGGGPVFPDLLERLGTRLPSTAITSVYGSTEAEPIAHQRLSEITSRQWTAMKEGGGLLAGRPSAGTLVRIVEDEIVVAGDHINEGYLDGIGDPENKVKDGGRVWHRTGDAGRLEADGSLWLRGRLSAKAGELFPFEAEVAARYWPGVTQAALIPATSPPALALQGAESEAGAWLATARKIGIAKVVRMRIPLDRRHRSKVDYVALRRALPDL